MLSTPPFLIGAALLFWGWQTGMTSLAVLMAVAVESAHWTKWRVEFSLTDFNRVWDLCSVLTVMAGLYCFLNRDGTNELLTLFQASHFGEKNAAVQQLSSAAVVFFQWWPMLLFLMVWVQGYGQREVVPFTTYSLLARRGLKRAGEKQKDRPGINFAFPYLAVCLFSASLTRSNPKGFYWFFVGICLWGFWAIRPRRFHPAVWVVLMGALVAGGHEGKRRLPRLASEMESKVAGWFSDLIKYQDQGKEFDSFIGDVADVKGSGKIVMRVKADGMVPELLRDTIYQGFNGRRWRNEDAVSYTDVPAMPGRETWRLQDVPEENMEVSIAASFPRHPTVVSQPIGTAMVDDLPAKEVTTNIVGTVRVREALPFVVYKVVFGAERSVDCPPIWTEEEEEYIDTGMGPARIRTRLIDGIDLFIPRSERRALRQVSEEIGLEAGQDEREVVERVSRFFEREFEYKLGVPRRELDEQVDRTLMSHFLLEDRRGHCELFATATAMLLREQRIPARYVLGWSVQESGNETGEFIVRARHAHAWCRWWSEKQKRWIDLDTTPPSWLDAEESQAPWYEPLQDWWSNRMHGFRMWRYYGDMGEVQKYLLAILTILVATLAWRLLFRRRKNGALGVTDYWWNFHRAGLDSEFYAVQKRVEASGLVRHDGESLYDWLDRLKTHPEVQPDLLRGIMNLHYRYRFDPKGLSDEERRRLIDMVRQWLEPHEDKTVTAG